VQPAVPAWAFAAALGDAVPDTSTDAPPLAAALPAPPVGGAGADEEPAPGPEPWLPPVPDAQPAAAAVSSAAAAPATARRPTRRRTGVRDACDVCDASEDICDVRGAPAAGAPLDCAAWCRCAGVSRMVTT
jgi:hypothetical protein